MKRLLAAAIVCAGLSTTAWADLAGPYVYGFHGITSNDETGNSVAIGEAQLTVEVTDAGNNQANFIFRNSGLQACSITDIYFDDGTLLGIATITDSGDGVSFERGASPPELPSGNTIGFETTAGFLADSDSPAQHNGVNPGEWVAITFNLINGKTFADTLNALAGGVDLRIGIHVQGFTGEDGGDEGYSEAFVNDPPQTPVPGAVLLGTLGLGAAGLRLRRKA